MANAGVCRIKEQYIIEEPVRSAENIEACQDDKSVDNSNTKEPVVKKPRLSKAEKKKLRGQNKSRPAPFKRDLKLELCKDLVDVAENETSKDCSNVNCPFLHDVNEYLKLKPADIGEICYNFTTRGRCPRGLACRFGAGHITSEGKNLINQDINNTYQTLRPQTLNVLPNDLQWSLRKRAYNFDKSENIVKMNDKNKARIKKLQEDLKSTGNTLAGQSKDQPKPTSASNSNTFKIKIEGEEDIDIEIHNNGKNDKDSIPVLIGTASDEDLIKLRSSEKKKIDWSNKLFLSPLTTVGNLPFRRICKEFGADITCGEMAMSASILQGTTQEWALVKKHHTEDIFGVQLCGNNPHTISKSAQVLQENIDVNFIDLNLGCPIDLVYKQGSGSGLLRRERVLEAIIRCTSQLLEIPFTVKTRTGVYADQNIAHKLIPQFRDWGASMVTMHGRSREQRYTRSANWKYIDECAGLAAPMPVFGNGDILSYDDYKLARETCKNISGVTIGRGALIKPWLFTEIKEKRLWDIRSSERFDILKKYANYGLEHWGSDNKGVENTRRFMLEWISFLHRYVPVGILENPPQRINERPPYYRGRDELETLMASANCADWVKISEMLLGPVPENFNFLPKHKANSYK